MDSTNGQTAPSDLLRNVEEDLARWMADWPPKIQEHIKAPLRESIAKGLEEVAMRLESEGDQKPEGSAFRTQAIYRAAALIDAAARVRAGEWG